MADTAGFQQALANNARPAPERVNLEVFHPCDGCGPYVRAATVWVLQSCECHGETWVLTFCGHCSNLQAPALHAQHWAELESETDTR